MRAELRGRVRAALSRLADRDREILVIRHLLTNLHLPSGAALARTFRFRYTDAVIVRT